MYHDNRCFDCLLSRVGLECELTGASESEREIVLAHAHKLITFLHTTPWTHPVVASQIHRSVYQKLGNCDPFAQLKKDSNIQAAGVIDLIQGDLTDFRSIVTAAVIGNIFDYGVKGHVIEENFQDFFRREFASGLYIDHTDEILALCRRIIYITDNCGEILFDKLLLTYLKKHGAFITLIVRDGPILNDATLEDAYACGLDALVDELITTGSGCEIGVRFDLLSEPVLDAFDQCSLIISKGMANYESLREEEGLPPIAFLLAAKCDPIAEELHVPRGAKLALLKK
ncbi:MAG TPA: ARMT1-like domain-containing protein [Methanospirillum sp.]|nr:ARMT1-like domain-containing protein [Methanospirillum sp.]